MAEPVRSGRGAGHRGGNRGIPVPSRRTSLGVLHAVLLRRIRQDAVVVRCGTSGTDDVVGLRAIRFDVSRILMNVEPCPTVLAFDVAMRRDIGVAAERCSAGLALVVDHTGTVLVHGAKFLFQLLLKTAQRPGHRFEPVCIGHRPGKERASMEDESQGDKTPKNPKDQRGGMKAAEGLQPEKSQERHPDPQGNNADHSNEVHTRSL